jgi:hypothetical protein
MIVHEPASVFSVPGATHHERPSTPFEATGVNLFLTIHRTSLPPHGVRHCLHAPAKIGANLSSTLSIW